MAGIRKSLPASLPKSTGQNGPLKGVKGERLAQWYDAVRHILLGIIWRKKAADPAASLLRSPHQAVETEGYLFEAYAMI